MSIQSKISKHTFNLSRKLHDAQLEHIGTEYNCIKFSLSEVNHYGDTEFTITGNNKITAYIDYPNNEIPLTFENGNTSSNSHLHMYDILPIEAYFKFSDSINYEDIIVHKIQVGDTDFQLVALQVTNQTVKANATGVVYDKRIVAPYTFQSSVIPNFETLLQQFLAETWL